MAAPVIASTSHTNSGDSTSFTITKPSGTSDGDLLIAFISAQNAYTVTNPSGWTQLYQLNTTVGKDATTVVCYKVAGASEPSNYTWTKSLAEKWTGGIARVTGFDSSNIIDASGSNSGTDDPSPDCPSITTVTDDALVFCFARITHLGVTGASSPKTDQWTEIQNNVSSYVGSYTQATAGATGTVTVTFTGGDSAAEWHSYQVAIKPTPPGDKELNGSATGTGSADGTLAITKYLTGFATGTGSATTSLPAVKRKDIALLTRSGVDTNAQYLPVDSNGKYCWFESFECPPTVNNGYDNPGWLAINDDPYWVDPNCTTKYKHGSQCLHLEPSGNGLKAYTEDFNDDLGKTWDNVYIKFDIWVSDWTSTVETKIFDLYSSYYSPVIRIKTTDVGTNRWIIGFYDGSWTDVNVDNVPKETWVRVEIKADFTTSNGAKVWINGGSPSATGNIDPGTTAYLDRLRFIGYTVSGMHVYVDMILIREASEYDDLIGDVNPLTFLTDDDDSTYFYPDDVSQYCFWSVEDLVGSANTPKALRVWYRIQWTSSSHYECRTACRYGGVTYTERFASNASWQNVFGQWDTVPYNFDDASARTPWAWNTMSDAIIGVRVVGKNTYGGKVSKIWGEAVYGDTGDAFVTHAPCFGGVTDERIRVWVRINEESEVKLRYSKSESIVKDPNTGTLNVDYWETSTSDYTETDAFTSARDFSGIINVTGLDANTVYYFDILVQQSGGYYQSTYQFEGGNSAEYWNTLPYCKTFVTEGSNGDWTFLFSGDTHKHAVQSNIWPAMAAKTPTAQFMFDAGDTWSIQGQINPNTLSNVNKIRMIQDVIYAHRGYHSYALYMQQNIMSKFPVGRIWSDWDFFGNNTNAIGQGLWGDSIESCITYESLRAFRQMVPNYDYAAPDNYKQTDTSGVGGSTTSLTDSNSPERQFTYSSITGGTPSEGDSVSWNSGSDTGTLIYYDSDDKIMIIELDDNTSPLATDDVVTNGTWSTSGSLSNIYNFPTVSKYGIYPGQVVRWIQHSDVTVTAYSFVKENTGTTLNFCQALSSSKSFATAGTDYLIQRGGIWHTFVCDNARFIVMDIRAKRDPNGTPGGDKCDGVTYGLVKNELSKDLDGDGDWGDSLAIYSVSGDNITLYHNQTDLTSYVREWDMVQIKDSTDTTTRGYFLVESRTNSTGSNDGTVVLKWEISDEGVVAGDIMKFYESAATKYDTYKEAINHGHVQRTWVEQTMSEMSEDWRILIAETPLYHGEIGNKDKWCDFDGMSFWKTIDKTSLTSISGNLYHTGNNSFIVKPGGVHRQTDFPSEGGCKAPLENVANQNDVTADQYWYYDSTNKRVVVYGNSNDCNVYRPNFWLRCAIRDYIAKQYENLNAIWIGADRHFAALDDASHEDDPWPHINASPLGRDPNHLCCRLWEVNSKRAYYASGMSANYDPLGESNANMGFAFLHVKNSEDIISVAMCERDGTTIDNSTNNDGYDYGDKGWLGDLEMDILFVNRIVDETFDDVTDYDQDYWVEVVN